MLIYLDCDTGVDDALAIALLLGRDDVTIAGIGTVDGNTSAVQAAANTLGVLALAGRDDIPVAIGSGRHRGGAPAVHGGNGVGGVVLPGGGAADSRTAVELLVELARRHPGELHVIATGPGGNLAAAMVAEPRLPELVASVTVMGGAVRVRGNVTPHAEANFLDDPVAAGAVLAAPWPLTLVPLDVTMQHRWTEADARTLRDGGGALGRALADMLPVYFDSYEPRLGERAVPLHDPLAAAIAVGEVIPADAPMLGLRVDPGTARVVEDPSLPHRVRAVLSLDRPAAPVLLDRILSACRRAGG
jgi:purine nucleosidase